MHITECDHKGKYLGLPSCNFNSKQAAFKEVEEKLADKLTRWKRKVLSMAGRVVLIKLVAQAIPGYMMQTFHLPKNLLDKMDNRIRRFFWGHDEDTTYNLHLKSWNSICLPKANGGLGIRSMRDMNMALISKMTWQLCANVPKLWVKLVKSMYLRGKLILDMERTTSNASWIWGEFG